MSLQRICVVGAGPGGLAVLQVLLAEDPEGKRWQVDVFEARDDIGGVWLPAPPSDNPPLTALYHSLTTNLPHPIMTFSTLQFPPSTPLFPRASVVLEYLRSYVAKFNLLPHIHLKTSVDTASWKDGAWQVSLSDGTLKVFDRLVMAGGHFRKPHIPPIPGVQDWLRNGRAMHSAWYRHPEPFRDAAVVIVGNGPSGVDLTSEVSTVARVTYHSYTGGSPTEGGSVRDRGRLVALGSDNSVTFEDGTTVCGIDKVILATGYENSFPCLESFLQPFENAEPLPPHLTTTAWHVYPLAKHIFPIQSDFPPSTLAFVGLPIRVVPFPLWEAQARVIAKVFSDPTTLDIEAETAAIKARSGEIRSRVGDSANKFAKAWHEMRDQEQFDHREQLFKLAGSNHAVGDWVPNTYMNRAVLRKQWRELEKNGEAKKWVEGVGEGGVGEWVEMMRKLLQRAEGAKEEYIPI